VYYDDIVIYNPSKEEHPKHLRLVCAVLRAEKAIHESDLVFIPTIEG